MSYHFKAGLFHYAVGDTEIVLRSARRARELLLEVADEDMSTEDELLLSRIGILVFKASNVSADEYVDDHTFVREAMICICDGIDPFGGLCAQIVQLSSLALAHRHRLEEYLQKRTRNGRSSFGHAQANKNASTKERALREWFHSGRELITAILARTLKVQIGNRYLGIAIISFLVGFSLSLSLSLSLSIAFISSLFLSLPPPTHPPHPTPHSLAGHEGRV